MHNTRLLTSLHMQALEYRQRWLLMMIVLVMPAVLFAANYYSVPAEDNLQPVSVPTHGGSITVYVESRETWPMTIGIMGVTWGVSTVAFFGVVGNLRKDRRLLVCGYRAWQIMLARLGLLVGLSVPLALVGMLPYTMISSSLHPELVWLACFLAGCIAAGFGLLIGILFFTPLLTVAYGVVGALVVARHPHNPIGWMFCATGVLSALNMLSVGYSLYDQHAVITGSLPGGEFAGWLTIWVWIPNVLLPVTFLLLLFPDGRLLSVRWRPVAWAASLGIAVITFGVAFHPGPLETLGQTEANPFGIPGGAGFLNALMAVATPLLLVGIFGSIAAVVVRFRHATGIERAQLKWIAFAGVIVVVGNIMGSIPWWLWPNDPLSEELSIIDTDFTIVSIVVAAGIAILRYRLWDIDIVINRTLVYGSLTTLIVGIYVPIVGSLGTLLQTGSSLPVSFLATGFIAISFQPLRQHLQRDVNHLMFGERDDPYTVLGRLSARLEAVVAAPVVLPTIVETVAEALKLPYAAIALKEGE